MFMLQLSQAADASGKGHIIVNAVHPGFCGTQLFKNVAFPFTLFFYGLVALLGRTAETGARVLLSGVFAGEEMHGKFLFNGEEREFPKCMQGIEGEKLNKRVWEELLELLEDIEPGVTDNI